MIVPMNKIFVAVRRKDRDVFLETLRELGVLQLVPVSPNKAVAQEETLQKFQDLVSAVNILEQLEPSGNTPALKPKEAAEKVLDAYQKIPELLTRHASIEKQIRTNARWGCICHADILAICEAGLTVGFIRIPADDVDKVQASCVEDLGAFDKTHRIIGIADKDINCLNLPESAQEIEAPIKDLPTLKAEATNLEIRIAGLEQSLSDLANLKGEIKAEAQHLAREINWAVAVKSGVSAHEIYAVTGWIPKPDGDKLADKLEQAGISAAVQTVSPDPGEAPPTFSCRARASLT